jgi:hypothetical protein
VVRRVAPDVTRNQDPTLFEKQGSTPPNPSGGRSRLWVGAIAALFLAVLVVLGVVLYSAASAAGGGGNGQTTGLVVLLLLPGLA